MSVSGASVALCGSIPEAQQPVSEKKMKGNSELAQAGTPQGALPPLEDVSQEEFEDDCFEDCTEEGEASEFEHEAISLSSDSSCSLPNENHAVSRSQSHSTASSMEGSSSPTSNLEEADQNQPTQIDWNQFQGSLFRGSPESISNQNCWMPVEEGAFTVKGETFFEDGALVQSGEPICQLVAVDWLHAEEEMGHITARRQSIVQRVFREHGANAPFFIVLNFQIPSGGADHYSLVCYFAIPRGSPWLAPGSLFQRFVFSEEDEFRRSRLLLIPAIPEGSWLVRSAVGTGQCVEIASVLETTFSKTEESLEISISMGTSTVVRGIVGLALGCISMLTVDLAFLLKATDGDELPEELFGAIKCCNLELAQAAPFSSIL